MIYVIYNSNRKIKIYFMKHWWLTTKLRNNAHCVLFGHFASNQLNSQKTYFEICVLLIIQFRLIHAQFPKQEITPLCSEFGITQNNLHKEAQSLSFLLFSIYLMRHWKFNHFKEGCTRIYQHELIRWWFYRYCFHNDFLTFLDYVITASKFQSLSIE